jgi:F-type H+-transporting ATPase subunit epsilon
MSFQCVIVTPEAQVLDETVTQVILPAHDGEIGILTDRAPLLVKLGVGALRIDLPGGQRRELFVEGGVAQMKDNRLTIVTNEAVPPSEIDADAARAEFAEATARRPTDEKSFADRQRQMARARAMEAMARK